MSFRISITGLLCLTALGAAQAQSTCGLPEDRIFADRFEASTIRAAGLEWLQGSGLSRPLNDTGTVWCADEDSYGLDCPVTAAPCQDAEYGRDLYAEAGMLPKVGAGDAGFDYTKLDATGNELPTSAPSWRCVRDNHTGLVWEVKQTDGSIYDTAQEFSWYNPDNTENANRPGDPDGGLCSDTDLDTLDLVAQANAEQLCGRTDWRLPDMPDMNTLFHFGARNPALDTDYFPNTNTANSYYSNTTVLYTGQGGYAWCANFGASGGAGACLKGSTGACRHARVVAGQPATSPSTASTCSSQKVRSTAPTSEFVIQPGGDTVLHEPTGLIWKRCVEGLSWNGSGCTGLAEGYDWEEALAAANAQDGWRVPNVRELLSLVEYCTAYEALNTDVFPGWTNVDSLWTSTPVYNSNIEAWQVDFFRGNSDKAGKYDIGVEVLLVKDAAPD